MSLIAKGGNEEGNKDFELTPTGNHVAVCYMVADLGVHESNWKGKSKRMHKIKIGWELPNELMSDGRPFGITKNYTLSLFSGSRLYQDLESWRGRAFTEEELKGFDVFAVLGVGCMLNVIHEKSSDGQKTYANVATVARLPKGMTVELPVNPVIKFSLSGGTNITPFEKLPEWLQKKINRDTVTSTEPLASGVDENTGAVIGDDFYDDDIPF